MTVRPVLAILALLGLAGCATGTGCGVDVETGGRRGRGAIVSPVNVLTVAHVVGDDDVAIVDGGLPARVVARTLRPTETGEDGLVLLEVLRGSFDASRVARVAPSPGTGIVYLAARGEVPWPWRLQPGDSGSPILDASGRLTGLVRAVVGRAEALDQARLSALSGKRPP